jgi:hypothetical protein
MQAVNGSFLPLFRAACESLNRIPPPRRRRGGAQGWQDWGLAGIHMPWNLLRWHCRMHTCGAAMATALPISPHVTRPCFLLAPTASSSTMFNDDGCVVKKTGQHAGTHHP